MPFPHDNIPALRAYLTTKAPPLLGSHIGSFLRANFPSFDFRLEHRTLREFLTAAFPGEIAVIGKSGPDDVYQFGSVTDSSVGSTKTADKCSNILRAWHIFQNPNVTGTILFELNQEYIYTVPGALSQSEADAGTFIIPRLSHVEQKEMMTSFLREYPNRPDIQPIQASIDSENPLYWKIFFDSVHRARLTPNWLSFRRETLYELFTQRLRSARASEPLITDILATVRTGTLKKTASAPSGYSVRPVQQYKSSSLRELAETVIPRLPEDELRQIKVSLGAVWDILREK